MTKKHPDLPDFEELPAELLGPGPSQLALPGTRTRAHTDHPLITRTFGADAIAEVLVALGITLTSELEIIKDAMDDPDIKIRLKGQAQLRALLKDVKQHSSVYYSATRKDDGSIEQTVTMAASPVMAALLAENRQIHDQSENPKGPNHDVTEGRGSLYAAAPRGADADPATQIARILSDTHNLHGRSAADGAPSRRKPAAADAESHEVPGNADD